MHFQLGLKCQPAVCSTQSSCARKFFFVLLFQAKGETGEVGNQDQ